MKSTVLIIVFNTPFVISIFSILVIIGYYYFTAKFISALNSQNANKIWRKNGPLDIFTSIVWVISPVLLLIGLLWEVSSNALSLFYLILFYLFFIFFFAFLYGLTEWHFERSLKFLSPEPWAAELQYIIMSVQTQTTLGYNRTRPNRIYVEVISLFQVLIGLFFTIIFIGEAVGRMR